jgi:SAM-dependent methyltransferase
MLKKLFARGIWFLKTVVAYLQLPMRLVQWTGKSPYPVHPKHLSSPGSQEWFLSRIKPGSQVLDVGCANGMHTLSAAAAACRVYGFDINLAQLHIAKAIAEERGSSNVCFPQASAETPFPFPRGCFDQVIFLDVLEHLNQRESALSEIHRVLKPDTGLLALAVPNRDTSWKKLRREAGLFPYSDPDHKIEYTRQEIEEQLHQSGFICESIDPIIYDTPWDWAIAMMGGLSLGWYRKLQDRRVRMAQRYPQESTGFKIIARPVEKAGLGI